MPENTANPRWIQGVDLLDVCQQFGTPLYVYDAEKIIRQIQRLRHVFSQAKFKYAAKSLTNLSVLRLMRQQGLGLDVVSVQEAQLGLHAGYQPQEIMYTPNGVAFEELKQAVDLGIRINVDNLPALEWLGKTYGSSVPCCIRLNPGVMAGGHAKISVGHHRSKFGIAASRLEDMLQVVSAHGMHIDGLHIHTGSDIIQVDAFMAGAELLFSIAHHFPDLQFIDFGSGFKLPYKPGDAATDLERLSARLQAAFEAFCQKYGRKLEMWFEPGKFLVSQAGYLLASVNVVKATPDITFAGLDTGLNHLIRPMMYDAYHGIANLSNPSGRKQTYDVVGYICETDTFASGRELPEVRQGDVLAIFNAGAYGFSMASNYNARLRPAEVLIYQGEARLIRERETLEDLLHHQIMIDL